MNGKCPRCGEDGYDPEYHNCRTGDWFDPATADWLATAINDDCVESGGYAIGHWYNRAKAEELVAMHDAAVTESLRAENQRLREALRPFADTLRDYPEYPTEWVTEDMLEDAARALEPDECP